MPTITIHLTQEQIQELYHNGDITVSLDVYNNLSSHFTGSLFFDFFRSEIERLKENGKKRTTETYTATYRKFLSFTGDKRLPFSSLDSKKTEAFQAYLREQGLAMNTISFYMRILKAVYNRAVERGLTVDRHPFRHVYTGIAKTSKRAISLEDLRTLKRFHIKNPRLQFARDMFLFSFYTRGMSFVDMAYLRKTDIRNGVLVYKRHKTGQFISILWEDKMQDIVDCYAIPGSDYLLPFIHHQNGKERNQYRNFQSRINHDLKIIAKMAGIGEKLTMYQARHSWATIARQMEVPIEVISRGMGHTNQKTTEIYLKSIDIEVVDRANRRIMELL